MHTSPKHCTTMRIEGMTCASCELLLERKIKAMSGVKDVDVQHGAGTARVTMQEGHIADEEQIASVIRKAGYSLAGDNPPATPNQKKWLEIGGSLLIIFAVYKLLESFDLVSLSPSTSGALSIGGIFVIGLVAGTSSCLAVTGGLLLAMAAKHNTVHQAKTPWHKFRPLLHFNIGRLLSYIVLGGLTGIAGQSLILSTKMTGYMNIVVALVMLYLALTILHIIPKGAFPVRPPKRLSRWIAGLSESESPAAPFALGAFTFFLPCGFTQSLQFAALASGSFIAGALIMGTFALGTLPALLGLSAISSSATGGFSRIFLRFSGALVLILALFNLQTGFALTGIYVSQPNGQGTVALPSKNGEMQEIAMTITRSGYEPDILTIKAGVPVRWTIDGSGAAGCTSVMTIPDLHIRKSLTRGENVIEFTAPEAGPLAFMCSMGMVRGTFNVL